MEVGFCATVDGGGDELRLLRNGPIDQLLSLHSDADLFVCLFGRIQYREDLTARLEIDNAKSLPAASLAARAYRRLGAEGITRLEGSFALVLFDRLTKRLLALRDPLGGYPLYWTLAEGRCGASTSLDALRTRFDDGGLDQRFIAEYLALPNFGQNEPRTARTPFRAISRLLPGHLFTFNAPSGDASTRPYWEWLDRLEDPGTDDVDLIAEGYAERLHSAVREGLCGTVASHLSGGMDSTSVSLLALDEMARGAVTGPLHAISLVYSQMRVLARERSVIDELTRNRNGLVAHRIEADGLLNFDLYADPPRHDEPWPWLSSAEIERARLEAALAAGADTVLTGHGADEMADTGPYHLTELLRRGALCRAWSVASQAARAENCSLWSIVYPFGIVNLLPLALRDGPGAWLRSGFTNWDGMGENTLPPWIRPEFARRHALRELILEQTREAFSACRPTVLSLARSKILNRSGDIGRWNFYAPRGIHVGHPFLDPRLLRYCLGIHARIPPLPRGRPKPILARAMRGVLPEAIRTRPKAGFFNEPYFRGLARHLGELEELARQPLPDGLDFLDRGSLIDCLRQSALGIGNARVQLDRVNLTLSLLKWLSLQSRPRRRSNLDVWSACGANVPL
jgi:asparagine synthase (glutamine-hydrolysing)